ncbi:MAG: hypothetical protein Kow0069_16310 [Promethearchaeota archaeon]
MKVAFICHQNACRSQMAEAFAKRAFPAGVEVVSAGLHPVDEVNPNAVKVMGEVGFDLTGARPKTITEEVMLGATLVVTMGCVEQCPLVPPGTPVEDWGLPDPAGKDLDFFRDVRDRVRDKVEELAKRLAKTDD